VDRCSILSFLFSISCAALRACEDVRAKGEHQLVSLNQLVVPRFEKCENVRALDVRVKGRQIRGLHHHKRRRIRRKFALVGRSFETIANRRERDG
jgi:hypothetical protein